MCCCRIERVLKHTAARNELKEFLFGRLENKMSGNSWGEGRNQRPRQRIDCQSKIYSTAIVRWIQDTVDFAETERSERKP
jgi:hypothetical protein